MISLKPGFFKRMIRTKFLPLNVLVSLIFFASCNPSLRFASVKYNATDINRLLDSTNMEYLTLQNNAPDAHNYKKPFTLIAYAQINDSVFVDTIGYDLQPLEGSKPKTFKGKTTLGNLVLTRGELLQLLTDPATGQRDRNFAYLLFTPARDKANGYLYFDVKATNSLGTMSDSSAAQITVVLRPCPPATWCHNKAFFKTDKIIN